jgi:transposase
MLARENAALKQDLREAGKQIEAQQAELDRYKEQLDRRRPNQPERVPSEQLQLAFERVLATLGSEPPVNDVLEDDDDDERPADQRRKRRARSRHGRRRLDLSNLPVQRVEVEPDEVKAVGGEGWRRIGEEISERVAFRPGCYFRLVLIRGKWVRVPVQAATAAGEQPADPEHADAPVVIGTVPESLWPRVMADPSAIANVIVGKYGDVLPLNRQESISVRHGWALPRSTQCEWLSAAHAVCHRVVDAMLAEARARAFCIATDSTGVPVRGDGACESWGMFVFVADRDHVVFRHAPAQDGKAVERILRGFHEHLLADASAIFDVLYRNEHPMTEVGCWFHARRYWWRGLEVDRERALEALALISKLFKADRECRHLPMPERTAVRAARAGPILELFDTWIESQRDKVDPRGPLDAAIGYYDNQRVALRRFLDDGRLRLDNNVSEAQLRNVVLGRHNWKWFANETGLGWYATFRSLIASCALHGLNAQTYLEHLLRLAPHWPVTRQLELSPKYWSRTIATLGDRARAIVAPSWGQPLEPTRGSPKPAVTVAA